MRFAGRLIQSAVTLLFIIVLSFLLQKVAPGGPFDDARELSPETLEALRREWRLDESALSQLGHYLEGVFSWPPDLKRSMTRPAWGVVELIVPRLMVSLSLAGVVLLLSLSLGILLGVWAAMHRHGWRDHLVMTLALIGVAVPNFVLAPLFKWLFALKLGWFPESRWVGPASMILPALSLSLLYIAIVARMVRGGLLDALSRDHVRAARARGFSRRRVILVHALPEALLGVVAWLGPAVAGLAVGSVVVERIFAIPGLGNTLVDAAFNRDYTMVMGAVIVYSVVLIAANLVTDGLAMLLDPRVREAA